MRLFRGQTSIVLLAALVAAACGSCSFDTDSVDMVQAASAPATIASCEPDASTFAQASDALASFTEPAGALELSSFTYSCAIDQSFAAMPGGYDDHNDRYFLTGLPDGRLVGATTVSSSIWVIDPALETLQEVSLEPSQNHEGSILGIHGLPGGQVAVNLGGELRVIDVSVPSRAIVLEGADGWAKVTVALPDGRVAATDQFASAIWVWDLDRPTEPLMLRGPSDQISVMTALPDGRIVAGSVADYRIWVWDPDAENPEKARPLSHDIAGSSDHTTSLAPAASGRVAVGGNEGDIALVDIVGNEADTTWAKAGVHRDHVFALAALDDGRIVSGGVDRLVRVSSTTGDAPAVLSGHTGWPYAFVTLPDGRFASTANDGTVQIWDPSRIDGSSTRPSTQSIRNLHLLSDGRVLIGDNDNDSNFLLWDLDSGDEPRVLRSAERQQPVLGAALMPDGRLAVAISTKVMTWDLNQPDPEPVEFVSYSAGAGPLAALSDGRLVTVSGDEGIVVRDGGSGLPWATLGGRTHVGDLAILDDGRIVAGGIGGWLEVHEPSGLNPPVELSGHEGYIGSFDVMRDGRIVSIDGEGVLNLWNLTQPESPTELAAMGDGVWSVAALDDGRIAWASATTSTVWVIDPADPNEVMQLELAASSYVELASLGGTRLLAQLDTEFVVWNVPT